MTVFSAVSQLHQSYRLCRLEGESAVRIRFVSGQFADPDIQSLLDQEQRIYNDFHTIDVQETYDNLVAKVGHLQYSLQFRSNSVLLT